MSSASSVAVQKCAKYSLNYSIPCRIPGSHQCFDSPAASSLYKTEAALATDSRWCAKAYSYFKNEEKAYRTAATCTRWWKTCVRRRWKKNSATIGIAFLSVTFDPTICDCLGSLGALRDYPIRHALSSERHLFVTLGHKACYVYLGRVCNTFLFSQSQFLDEE